jgi:CRP-like cAMP-binding protein
LTAVWLSPGSPKTAIETLVLQLLEPNLPNPRLRQALLDELVRPVKPVDVVLEYLGLRAVEQDAHGELPLLLVAPKSGEDDPWREALLLPGGDCPIGILVKTRDLGQVALVHEAFGSLAEPHQTLVRRYAALAARGTRPERIATALKSGTDGARRYADLISGARRQIASVLDPSVLLSRDGAIRVQVGSLSETTRNLLRDGLRGEYIFVLPHLLFEGRTNYADIEFLIYLNFFVRRGQPTRIVGTARQRRTLERLLTLVIFGVFDPDAGALASFEELRASYGVADLSTYAFLRMAYEAYAVRATGDPSGPVQGLASYIDFTVLESGGTVIPIHHLGHDGTRVALGDVRVASAEPGGFDVRITQADDRVVAKQMDVTTRRRPLLTVPEDGAEQIRFGTKRPRFGATPLGTSHGFDPAGDVTSFIIWINGRGMFVDPSSEALAYLRQIGVAEVDVPFVFLTHIHADHDSGLIEKLLSGSRTTVIASDVVFRSFTEKARLVTGHDVQREGLVNHIPANPGRPVETDIGGERVMLETRWNLHPIPTNGFKISVGDKSFGYSGDTQYDAALLHGLHEAGKLTSAQFRDLMYFFWTPAGAPTVDLLYHEAGIPPIHTDKQQLQALPDAVTSRTFLVHIADTDVPPGFLPAKPDLFMTHTLLPPTDAIRRQALLGTMRLVSYLYDIPVEVIKALLRDGEVREYGTDVAIIQKGPLADDAALAFYVVVDGEVAVKDGRRLIDVLTKGDSFGEWGISHQRGFRTADVVAARPSQCIEFGEERYRWLVGQYPVIQERIGVIRRLLPRLQLAQTRARMKLRADPAGRTTVLAAMSSSQLSSFALFSTVAAFNEGQPVIVEGTDADGFYVLLSGHLVATVKGRIVGELSEGDIFGEMGLLEGGRRAATVSAVSADAEVLFMSTENFRDLLYAVPAFALDVRETAAQRSLTSSG